MHNIKLQFRISSCDIKIFEQLLTYFKKNNSLARLLAKDASIFSNRDEHRWLGWIDEPCRMQTSLATFAEIRKEIFSHRFSHIVLLGMGGSSLSARVFQTLIVPNSQEYFFILDSINPDVVHSVLKRIDLQKTLFIISSKSGSTLEPNMLYKFFLQQMIENDVLDPFEHFMAITDPITSLEQESQERGFLRGAFGNPEIGGRFSGLSPFGILPALLMGADVERIINGAVAEINSLDQGHKPSEDNTLILATLLALCMKEAPHTLAIMLPSKLRCLGSWLEQLLGESLGKNGLGVIPMIIDSGANKAPNSSVVVEISFLGSTSLVLCDLQKSVIKVSLQSVYDVGAFMYLWQVATALAASQFGINPFDQPDVETSKVKAKKFLAQMNGRDIKQDLTRDELFTNGLVSRSLKEFFLLLRDLGYCAILSYLKESAKNGQLLSELKSSIAKNLNPRILLQTGPRYLHSTGQLFKGGPNTGGFIVLTSNAERDGKIDQDKCSLATVLLGQARGDVAAMKEGGRNIIHLHLDHVKKGILELTEIINTRFGHSKCFFRDMP